MIVSGRKGLICFIPSPFVQVEKGACGQGKKNRGVWCQREDGQRVDFQHCSRQISQEKRESKKDRVDGADSQSYGGAGDVSPYSSASVAASSAAAGDVLGANGGVIRKHKQIIEEPLQTEATCHVPCPEV